MRLDLTEEQLLLRDTARRFMEAESPLPRVRDQFDSVEGFSRAWWSKVSEMGFTSLMAPESLGGTTLSGNPARDAAIVAEEFGRAVAPGPFLPTAVVLQAIGSDDETGSHRALVPELISGQLMVAWAFGEPGSCWRPESFRASVRVSGDEIILNGTKAYVEAGAEADLTLVTARSERGLTQVFVPADAPGLSVTPGRSLDFVRRFATLRFEDVRLPLSSLVGEPDQAEKAVTRQLQLALLLQCAETNGSVERAFEMTIGYMGERYAFGRPIASYQALKHRVADMALWIHSAMATTDSGLQAFDARAQNAFELATIAKTYVATKSTQIVSDLAQLTGGIAMTWDYDLHMFQRRVAVNRAVLGTPEHHRLEIYRSLCA